MKTNRKTNNKEIISGQQQQEKIQHFIITLVDIYYYDLSYDKLMISKIRANNKRMYNNMIR